METISSTNTTTPLHCLLDFIIMIFTFFYIEMKYLYNKKKKKFPKEGFIACRVNKVFIFPAGHRERGKKKSIRRGGTYFLQRDYNTRKDQKGFVQMRRKRLRARPSLLFTSERDSSFVSLFFPAPKRGWTLGAPFFLSPTCEGLQSSALLRPVYPRASQTS